MSVLCDTRQKEKADTDLRYSLEAAFIDWLKERTNGDNESLSSAEMIRYREEYRMAVIRVLGRNLDDYEFASHVDHLLS